jgi:LytR cell envelope-related transcriptional attenuator
VRTVAKPPSPPVRTSRVARAAARERRRRLTAALVAIALVGAAAAWLLLSGGAPERARSEAGVRQRSAPAPDGPAPTVAISLQGAAEPLMAVVAPNPRTTPALTIPADMSLAIPGLGDGTSATIAGQDGEGLRVSLSNTVGAWIDHYLVLDVNGLASLADTAGGFVVTLPGTATLSSGAIGPGPVTMTGGQVAEYLGIDGPNAFTRWEVVLPALLQARTGGSLTGQSDDLEAVSELLPVGGEVRIDTFPTRISASSAWVPDYGALDDLMAADFGVERPPVRVLVQNGVGDPGIGAEVAARIVPKGFRVVWSANAGSFELRATQVVAGGDEYVDEAKRARRALGVGDLGVTQVPSGVADITIVIGKDFTA